MANFSALLSSTYVEWPVINVWNAARHSPKSRLHTAIDLDDQPRRVPSPPAKTRRKKCKTWVTISIGEAFYGTQATVCLRDPERRLSFSPTNHRFEGRGNGPPRLSQVNFHCHRCKQQHAGGFLSPSVFLPFNRLGYTVYVWQQMKRCMFACWATKHQHGKPKCTTVAHIGEQRNDLHGNTNGCVQGCDGT